MGHKIFVSYKYADSNVKNLPDLPWWETATVRKYVDILEEKLEKSSDHIYKGEEDGEDLSTLSDERIWELLKKRIYDSSLTIVMISPGMKETGKSERDQWIPQEISYSLKEIKREDKAGNKVTSRTNAMIGVVLPDKFGSYDYFFSRKSCCIEGCTIYHSGSNIFGIINNNLFNHKSPNARLCTSSYKIYYGYPSYILCVRWGDFISNMESYIKEAYVIQEHAEDYDIQKEI